MDGQVEQVNRLSEGKMIKKPGTRFFAAIAAFLAASVASEAVFAVVEIEPNDTIATAQRLVISGGGAQVTGILGNGLLGVNDVDFYSFAGNAGDVVTAAIQGGYNINTGTGVDTYIAIFKPDSTILAADDDAPTCCNAGSSSTLDAFIGNPGVRLPTTGIYTVGVTNSTHPFLPTGGGAVGLACCGINLTGSYTLVISGVSDPAQPAPAPAPVVQQINIEIRPGVPEQAPINPKSQGAIPVALLSNPGFDAFGVDTTSITFGHSGNEHSLIRCFKERRDVNGDGLPDLLCHFDNQVAGFEPSDTAGMLKGRMATGGQFEGQGYLKVVPVKRR
jgi:hypothetical protein